MFLLFNYSEGWWHANCAAQSADGRTRAQGCRGLYWTDTTHCRELRLCERCPRQGQHGLYARLRPGGPLAQATGCSAAEAPDPHPAATEVMRTRAE
uniref:GH16986p n=1 Tax=Drosophila melanogaster TaxID=7227 RepID=Q8T0N9_DROME|nr:GH16986p [Drosophila melanogaster]